MTNRAPIIAAILLLLPVLYVGSYLVVVEPEDRFLTVPAENMKHRYIVGTSHYCGASTSIAKFYSPLEWMDRKIRPDAWKDYSRMDAQTHPDRVLD